MGNRWEGRGERGGEKVLRSEQWCVRSVGERCGEAGSGKTHGFIEGGKLSEESARREQH